MPTRLIINADDFGYSRGVTDGILHCHKNGILTSATLMTTMPDRDRAIDLAGQTPALGVGVHLSLTEGTPLTPCRRIQLRDGGGGGFIRSLPRLFLRLRSRAACQEAQDELVAQIEYARSRGLTPTHVDSHMHVCHFPPLHAPLIAACRATGVTALRTAREAPVPGFPRLRPAFCVLVCFAHQLASRAKAEGLHTTDFFLGLATTGKTTSQIYRAVADHPPQGLGEFMVHPGYIHDITRAQSRLLQERVVELEALCSSEVRQTLDAAAIERVNYAAQ